MFKDFLMKKMLAAQLKSLPEEHRNMIERLVEKDPQTLMAMAQDVQTALASGVDQQTAFMTVAKKYEAKLKELLQ